MLVLVTAGALLVTGWALAAPLWRAFRADAPEGLERACAAITIAFTLWIGIDWALALTHTFSRGVVLLRTAVAVIAAGIILLRARPRIQVSRVGLILAVLIASWSAFMLWRGAIMPPVTHDVLSNHLPRAVFFARAAGFLDLSRMTVVFDDIPMNYEILLTDVLLLQRGDEYTEWLSTILYVLFIPAAGALAKRWWNDVWTTRIVMLFVAGVPVLLLHSGAHKNDLLTGVFMVLAMVWAGRFFRTGDPPALLLLICSAMIATGSKTQGGLLAVALLPLVAWRIRAFTGRVFAATVVTGVLALLLLGGFTYVDNYLVDVRPTPGAPGAAGPSVPRYGDWANLWQAPWVLATAPLSPNPLGLYVPWEERRLWFWRRNEIYFSHLGALFTVCLLAAPFAAAAWKRGDPARGERLAVSAAALATVLVMLPVYFPPHGNYLISLPRYLLFFLVAVMAWSVGAVLRTFGERAPALPRMLFLAGAVDFLLYGIDTALYDSFSPLDAVLDARNHPGTRHIPFDPNRATSEINRWAGPHDLVALDAVWGTWVHPAFGPRLSRPIYFIPPGDGPPLLPEQTQWVVVERAYNVVWGNPNMKTLADARFLGNNTPSPAETRVIDYLRADPRFRLVRLNRRKNQAIFQRVR